MPKCDFVHEAWGPHPGCKEFMTEPETWPCSNEATTVTVSQFSGPSWPDHEWETVIFPTYACAEHLYTDDLGDPFCTKILYTMPIDGSEV